MPPSLLNRPAEEDYREVCAVYFNALESYLFHSTEFVQAVVERRAGAGQDHAPTEVTAWEDEGVWEAVERGEFSWDLVEKVCASSSEADLEAIRRLLRDRGTPVAAFWFTFRDGLQVTHFMQKDIVRKWCLAARLADGGCIAGAVRATGADHYHPHFARLCVEIESFIETGVPPIPLDRIRKTSLQTALGMQALGRAR